MSEDNVEIVRRTCAAFNRRDFDTVLEGLDPDIEWHQITQFPDRAVPADASSWVWRVSSEVRRAQGIPGDLPP